ncbi:protein MID1-COMPLEMENTING ACTIVITY 1-like [Hibiscus syriacus]|uniref:Protein MID1-COMPLEMENTING ACTIVITY 1-like n=1 Tax=Hibiscus syriacus TaxID=106335 RepID=A0A6A2X205_HIBSY|nr:protein MID1-COMPLEMENTING ACTIVITY 1-like [Hibiscus syriacus]
MASTSKNIILKSSDGQIFEVEEAVALQSKMIKNMIEDDCADEEIPLPNVTGRSCPRSSSIARCRPIGKLTKDDQLKTRDDDFLQVDLNTLHDLIMSVTVKEGLAPLNRPFGRFEGLDAISHGLIVGGHLSLGIEPDNNNIEPGRKPQVVYLLNALANGIIGVDTSSVHRFSREFEFHDLVQELLGVTHGWICFCLQAVAHVLKTLVKRPWSENLTDKQFLTATCAKYALELSEVELENLDFNQKVIAFLNLSYVVNLMCLGVECNRTRGSWLTDNPSCLELCCTGMGNKTLLLQITLSRSVRHDILRREVEIVDGSFLKSKGCIAACGHDILRREIEIVDGSFVVKLSFELDILLREVEI